MARAVELLHRARTWLADRLPIDPLTHVVEKKEVPVHRHSIWYYFGGMALFLLGVQIVTGVLLLLYYRPSAEGAFESVQFIMTEVRFGWLIRSVHSWSANLLIGVLFVHLASAFFMRAYRRPRELTWITGVLLLFVMMGFGFSGYLLPWNQLAFFATKVGTEIMGDVPLIGAPMLRLLRGGEEVTGATLSRFFALHVAILPAALLALVAVHLVLIQRLGISVPPGVERQGAVRGMRFFPNFFLRDLVGWLLMLALLAFLSALYPWDLGEKADPFAPAPEGIQPEWYFLFMFQALKILPAHVLGVEGETLGILVFGAAAVVLVFVPFLDHGAARGTPGRGWTWAGTAAVAFIVAMTIWAWLAG